MRIRITAATLGAAALILAACGSEPAKSPAASAPVAAKGRAEIAPWGLDLAIRDPAVKPGDDFFRYADGRWMDAHTIPGDRTTWGSFAELDERATQQQLQIVQQLPADAPAGSNAHKVGDYYRAFIDTAAIDALGLAPARPGLEAIAAARNHQELARLMGRADLDLLSPLRINITIDQKDPDRYAVTLQQSGLGLPDRDYYLKDDPVYRELRAKYLAHMTRLLTLAGEVNAGRRGARDHRCSRRASPSSTGRSPSAATAISPTTRAPVAARGAGAGILLGDAIHGRGRGGPAAVRGARAGRGAGARAAVPGKCRSTPGGRTSSTTTW